MNHLIFIFTWLSCVPAHMDSEDCDDSLVCQKEPGNLYDANAVAIVRDERIAGHVPHNFSEIIFNF